MKFKRFVGIIWVAALASGGAFADAPSLPVHPLFGDVSVSNIGGPPSSLGTAIQVLHATTSEIGITNFTFANPDPIPHRIRVFVGVWSAVAGPTPTAAHCFTGNSNDRNLEFIVPASSTLVVPYPTALVFTPSGGATCLFAQLVTKTQIANVEVMATGFAP